MNDKDFYKNISDHYISFEEANRIASNLDRIELMREQQKQPSSFVGVKALLAAIIYLGVVLYMAYMFLCCCDTVVGTLIILVVAGVFVYGLIHLIVRIWKEAL